MLKMLKMLKRFERLKLCQSHFYAIREHCERTRRKQRCRSASSKKKLVKRGSTIIWILDAYDSEHDKLFVGLVLQNDSH